MMISALHAVSYLAGTGAFLFILLSLASGLLYIAEVIEEHAKLAKIVGQRTIYTIIALLVIFHLVDHLPLQVPLCIRLTGANVIELTLSQFRATFSHITALGIFCHVVYLQNFSKSWPSISLFSPTFILSCLLVVVNHLVCFNHFSDRARSTGHYSSGYGSRSAAHGGRMNVGRSTSGRGIDESFLDVATYFGLCVWLCPFFLFLSLSANDNVLPSSGDASGASSPMQTRAPSPVTSGRANPNRQTFLKTLISLTLGFIPTTINRSKRQEDLFARPRVEVKERTFLPEEKVESTPDVEGQPPRLEPGWNGSFMNNGGRSVSGPLAGARERLTITTYSNRSSPIASPLHSPPASSAANANPFSLGGIPAGAFLPPSARAALTPPSLGPRRHTTEEGLGLGVGAGSPRAAQITQFTNAVMAQSSSVPPTSGTSSPRRASANSLGVASAPVESSVLRHSISGPTPSIRGPPPPAASSGMAFSMVTVPSNLSSPPTMGQGTPPRPAHRRAPSLQTPPPAPKGHERRQSVGTPPTLSMFTQLQMQSPPKQPMMPRSSSGTSINSLGRSFTASTPISPTGEVKKSS